MLKWLSSIGREFRISLDWPRFDKEERHRYVTQAYERFPTQGMEADLDERLKRVRDEAGAKFNADRDRLNMAAGALQPKVTEANRLVRLFQRNYHAELEALYAEKNRLHGEIQLKKAEKSSEYESLSELHEEKKELHKKRQRLTSEIDSWYAEAKRHPKLLGKKNREIPKSSFFGISQNSLESAKRSRELLQRKLTKVQERIEEANSAIGSINKSLEQITSSLSLIKQRIMEAKKDRTEFFNLKKSGVTHKALKTESEELSLELTRLHNLTIALEEEQAYFIRNAEDSAGVPALRTELDRRLKIRVAHLKTYDLPEQQVLRKQRHREQWLAKHRS